MSRPSSLFSALRSTRNSNRNTTRRARLGIEGLETRLVPAADPIVLSGTILTLNGDNGDDFTTVSIDTRGDNIILDDKIVVSVFRGGEFSTQTFPRFSGRYVTPTITEIVYHGNDGNDVFTNLTPIRSIAHGDQGDDALYGGSGNDQLLGEDGDDYIHGGAGDDTVSGGANNDLIFGDEGRDLLLGQAGDDTIYGGVNTRIEGGDGNDTIYGGDNDIIYGDDRRGNGTGNDTIYGGDGIQHIFAGDGNDYVDGGAGDDHINGGKGNDTINAGDGNDRVSGGDGDDQIDGGKGNDLLSGGNGRDVIHGGADNDSVLGDGDDDQLFGEAGNDLVYGGSGDDFLSGGEDNDYCFGGDDSDEILGGNGDDVLSGGSMHFKANALSAVGDAGDWSSDFLEGDAGVDQFIAGNSHFGFDPDTYIDVGDGENVYFGNFGDEFVPHGFYDGDEITTAGHMFFPPTPAVSPVGNLPDGVFGQLGNANALFVQSQPTSRELNLGGRLLANGSISLTAQDDSTGSPLSGHATVQAMRLPAGKSIQTTLDLNAEFSAIVKGTKWTADVEVTGTVTLTRLSNGRVRRTVSLHVKGEVTSELGSKPVDGTATMVGDAIVLKLPVIGMRTIRLK